MDLPVDGLIYGRAPSPPPLDVPDVVGMFEAANIPGPKEGGLPFSLEWYAGAKDRAKAREKEKDRLLAQKAKLRTAWAEMIWDDMHFWGVKVDAVRAEPPTTSKLAELLARVMQERPDATNEIVAMRDELSRAAVERDRLCDELDTAREHLRDIETSLKEKEAEDVVEEEARIAREYAERARKAQAEEALKKNKAMMLGQELPSAQEQGQVTEDGFMPSVPQTPAGIASSTLTAQASPVPEVLPGVYTPPSPVGVRGGLASQLPPIAHPPPPPLYPPGDGRSVTIRPPAK